MEEIRIIGGGPSGLTAAINLAKKGFHVKVYEKKENCGMRFHGDFQGLENWSLTTDILEDIQRMNIAIDFWHKPIYQCDFYDYKLSKRTIKFKKPALYLIKRGVCKHSLDLSLKKQAIHSGVELLFKRTISEAEGDIIAVGPRYVHGIVRGMVFNTEIEHAPIIILDNSLAPNTFAYLLTSEGMGCLGTGLRSDFRMTTIHFERTLKTFKKILNLDISNARMFTGYGNFFLRENYENKGKLYVGECAGLQDFLFAFGLRQAITSGYLAAKSIIDTKSYDDLIKHRFQRQLQISISNRLLFNLLGNRGYSFFLKKGKKYEDPLYKMYKQYNPSFLKNILFPIAKLIFKK